MVEKSAREIEPFGSTSVKDVLADLDVDPLDTLTTAERRVLAIIMSRFAERSYRRGGQQGATTAHNQSCEHTPALPPWRYRGGEEATPCLAGQAHTTILQN